MLFYDMGLGKSTIALNSFRYRRKLRRNYKCRMLILVPLGSNVQQWLDEVQKHAPMLRAIGITGKGEGERLLQLSGRSDAVVCTYAGFLALVCKPRKPGKGKRKPKNKWEVDENKLYDRFGDFNFVTLDELTLVASSPSSLTTLALKKLSWNADYALGLTGTPHDKDPGDLWSQFYIIDKGETLGPTVGLFHDAFFRKVFDPFNPWAVKFDERKATVLNRVIRHRSIRYEDTEVDDLPKRVYVRRPVIFPEEAWQYYNRLIELTNSSPDGVRTEMNWHKLRQLCSGYLSMKDPVGGQMDIKFDANPKIDDLLNFLSSVRKDRKVIVFLEYKKSGDLVCEALRKAKIKHVRLYSKTADKANVVKRFQNDPTVRVIVSSSAGAFGGNWQVANHEYFFESPVRPMIRKQMEKRAHRMGQSRTVFIHDCYVKGSVEEKIRWSVRHGIDLLRKVVDGKMKLEKR